MVGCPKDKDRTEAFLEVISYLEENDDEQITVTDLVNRMEDNLARSEHWAYSKPHLLQKLQKHFGERIIQTEIHGKPNVVTFRNKAKTMLQDFHSQMKVDREKSKLEVDPKNDKLRTVETAAKLI